MAFVWWASNVVVFVAALAFTLAVVYAGVRLWAGLFPRHTVVSKVMLGDQDMTPVLLDRWKLEFPGVGDPADRAVSPNAGLAFVEVWTPPSTLLAPRKLEEPTIDLEVQGLDVGELITRMIGWFRQPEMQLKGEWTHYPNRETLALRLEYRRSEVARTEVVAYLSGSETDDALESVRSDMAGQALSDLMYAVAVDSTDQPWKDDQPFSAERFPTAEAWRSFRLGRYHLERYLKTRNPRDLDNAQEDFEAYVLDVPSDPDGIFLLGLTLTENRNEPEAYAVFGRLVGRLDNLLSGSEIDDEERSRLKELRWHALYYRGVTRLKHYRWVANIDAIGLLLSLESELDQEVPDTCVDGQDDYDSCTRLAELRVETQVQIAHAFSLFWAYLRHEDLGNASASLDNARKGWPASTRAPLFRWELPDLPIVEQIARYHLMYVERAKTGLAALTHAEGIGLSGRLRRIEGYGLFRVANWLEDAGVYRDVTDSSLAALRSADGSSYLVAENIGMVLSDERRDPLGEELDRARRELRRAANLNPDDYYAVELLARAERRALDRLRWTGSSSTVPVYPPDDAFDSEDYATRWPADKAIELNPTSIGAWVARARLGIVKWVMSTSDERPGLARTIDSDLRTANTLGGESYASYWLAMVEWSSAKLKWEEHDVTVDADREALAEAFAEARRQAAAAMDRLSGRKDLEAALARCKIDAIHEMVDQGAIHLGTGRWTAARDTARGLPMPQVLRGDC